MPHSAREQRGGVRDHCDPRLLLKLGVCFSSSDHDRPPRPRQLIEHEGAKKQNKKPISQQAKMETVRRIGQTSLCRTRLYHTALSWLDVAHRPTDKLVRPHRTRRQTLVRGTYGWSALLNGDTAA